MSWIQTYTGLRFYPLQPERNKYVLVDIAHALALECRFGNHCPSFYSVAEHSIHLSRLVFPEHALWALLHDAHEAYTGDTPRPLKTNLNREVERGLQVNICRTFGLLETEPEQVKLMDNRLLRTEHNAFMTHVDPRLEKWVYVDVGFEYWGPEKAEERFLQRFQELTR